MPKGLVVYVTFTGKTLSLAEVLAEGARAAGAEVTLKRAGEVTAEDLSAADAVTFGTPQPFGSMSGEMKALFERVWGQRFTGKPMVAFVVASHGGTDTLETIEALAGYLGFEKASPGVVAPVDRVDALKGACRKLGETLAAALT